MKRLFLYLFVILFSSCLRQEQPKQYSVSDFYNSIGIIGGSFSSDESRILLSSNESGIFNLYEISIADGSKKQVTDSKIESFFAYDYVPGTQKMIYGADEGGNELTHIYLLNEDGSKTDLTPGEKVKAEFGGWSKDKKFMYYLTTERDQRFFDMYKCQIGDWKPEMIFENKDGYFIMGVSPEGSMVALGKTITTSENQLFLFSRDQNKLTEISDPQLPAEYIAAAFTADGRYFYYITNAGKEFSYLVKYETETGEKETVYETTWDVAGAYLSENDKYLVIIVNEDAKNALLIKETVSGNELDLPDLPELDINEIIISESENRILLKAGTSRTPTNLYVYDITPKDLKKLTETLNPAIDKNDLVQAEPIRYKSFDGLEIPAIYLKPKGASKKNKVPALVYVHGGPGGQTRMNYSSQIQSLVNHGYAVLGVNNRGSSGYGKSFYKLDDKNHGDKDLKDCIWGKKWLQEQEYIDPERIGIMGGSYGGYMTMAAMTFTPEEFKAGVNLFGVTNWIRTLKSVPPDWESFRVALYDELGDPFRDDSIRLYKISPLFHADSIRNPVLVLQGANDRRVLQIESDEIVDAMKRNKVPVEYIIFPDEGHGFLKKENNIKATEQAITFLDRYLKGEDK